MSQARGMTLTQLRRLRFIGLIVFLLGAAAYQHFFHHPSPSVKTPWVMREWSTTPLDAGTLHVDFKQNGLEFIHVKEPERSFALIRRGEQYLRFNDITSFVAVDSANVDQTWATFIEEQPDGQKRRGLMGIDTREKDQARVSDVPFPTSAVTFGHLSASGTLEASLGLEAVGSTPLSSFYVTEPGQPVQMIGPGHIKIYTRNGGRTWFLQR